MVQIRQTLSLSLSTTGAQKPIRLNTVVFNMSTSNAYRKQYIHFPSWWHEKWSNEGTTDLDKAKVILYDFNFRDSSMNERVKLALWQVLRLSESPSYFKNVTQLATNIQDRVFENHHDGFHRTQLLRKMQFILLKCQPNLPQTRETDRLRNFFFDPAIPLGSCTANPSGGTTFLEVPKSMLKIVIVGGGPTGLLAAINLTERVRCRDLVQIHVYDKRWMKNTVGELEFTAYPEYQRRRDQVVTLQEHVMKLLSEDTTRVLKYGLAKRGPERVWPDSSNLQISKIEDALLKRAQDSIFDGIIHLHSSNIIDEAMLVREAGDDFHLLLGTDGANSWVRRSYFSAEEEQCGRNFALGVALNCGDEGLPRLQALNVLITLCQMRFQLNASDRYGTGYLNMLLTEEEYNECVALNGAPADFRSPACIRVNEDLPPGFTNAQVFAPYHRNSALWQSISDGLRLFGFQNTEVKNIVRIPINLIGVKTVTKVLNLKSATRRHDHCLVSLAGDSALTHHFWPGRGMNSGIKAAIVWSDEVSDLILEREQGLVGLRADALNRFSDFMKDLREREHTHRSLIIQDTAGLPEQMEKHMKEAHKLAEPDHKIDPELCERIVVLAKRLEDTPRWPHQKIKDLSGTVMSILRELETQTKAEMYYSGPWPTDKMSLSGREVIPPKPRIRNLPRSMAARSTFTRQNYSETVTPTTASNPPRASGLEQRQFRAQGTQTGSEREPQRANNLTAKDEKSPSEPFSEIPEPVYICLVFYFGMILAFHIVRNFRLRLAFGFSLSMLVFMIVEKLCWKRSSVFMKRAQKLR